MKDYRQITQEEAREIMEKDKDITVLDVRTPEEFAAGHIKGAVNVPLSQIGDGEIGELPDHSRRVLVYCRSGVRSKMAAEKLAAKGYENVEEFGGVLTWRYGLVR